MTGYKIEKNIPVTPPRGGLPGRWRVAVLEKMDIGDSFFDPDPKSNWRQSAQLKGWGVSERKEGTGKRIWRVK